jgi:hypothetical protein
MKYTCMAFRPAYGVEEWYGAALDAADQCDLGLIWSIEFCHEIVGSSTIFLLLLLGQLFVSPFSDFRQLRIA